MNLSSVSSLERYICSITQTKDLSKNANKGSLTCFDGHRVNAGLEKHEGRMSGIRGNMVGTIRAGCRYLTSPLRPHRRLGLEQMPSVRGRQ